MNRWLGGGTSMSAKWLKPVDHFDVEQWDRVYTTRAGGDFVFRRGVELAKEISYRVSSPGEVWLDVGCGTGHLAAMLSRTGRSVIGVDHDPTMIDYAKRRFLNEHSTNELNFIAADAYNLPFGNETVDGVVATSLAGCLSFPERFFQETYRVLCRGGYAVMTFTNRDSSLLKINSYLRKIMPPTGGLKDNNFSFRLYQDKRLAKDLKRNGFTVIEVSYYSFFLNWGDRLLPPASWAVRAESLKNSKIQRRLGRNFIVLMQKI
jgi:ubiquinone/menaquinone biosynthesis C-methylase UbiE